MAWRNHAIDAHRADLFRKLPLTGYWALVVLVFAAQWYTYDAARAIDNPFAYYLGWSCYLWAQAPLVIWLARRYPLDVLSWRRHLPLHLLAGIALSALIVFVEAGVGWMRVMHGLSLRNALRHYYGQHAQIALLSYWLLVLGMQFQRNYDQSRARQLHMARLEARLAQARMSALRAQLHPHFLFNTLNAVTTLIYEDPKKAQDVVLRLSELLRMSLQESHLQEIPLRREIELLECYMGIQRHRFEARLRFELQIDEALLGSAVPTLILQPLVENAIRHGIGKNRGEDLVSVHARQVASRLKLTVGNRNSSLEDSAERLLSRGVGLSNTAARLQELYGAEQSLRLEALATGGVLVTIELPLRPLCAPAAFAAEVAG